MGTYITLEADAFLDKEPAAFSRGAAALARAMGQVLQLGEEDAVLVVGLGNRAVTPDAIGPLVIRHTMVTRHLKAQMPEDFQSFRPVVAVGVPTVVDAGTLAADLTGTKPAGESQEADMIVTPPGYRQLCPGFGEADRVQHQPGPAPGSDPGGRGHVPGVGPCFT